MSSMFRQGPTSRQRSRSPYRIATMPQHRRQRPRSPAINRSFSQQSGNNSHNSSTVHSEHLWHAMSSAEIYPPVCFELLKNEDKNISEFKKTITREKNKINTEVSGLLVQITHMIEDYRLSLHAVIDRIYQQYISHYADFKTELLEANRLKDEIEAEFALADGNKNIKRQANDLVSNENTIKALQSGVAQMKKYHLINYIIEMQKERLPPIVEKAEFLTLINIYDNGFFQNQEFRKYTEKVKTELRQSLHINLDQVYSYIRDPEGIIMKQKNMRKHESSAVLDQMPNDFPPLAGPGYSFQVPVSIPALRSQPNLANNPSQSAAMKPTSHMQSQRPTFRGLNSAPTFNIQSQPQIILQEPMQLFDPDSKSHTQREMPVSLRLNYSSAAQMQPSEQNNLSSFSRRQPISQVNLNSSSLEVMYQHQQSLVFPHKGKPESIRISEGSPACFKTKSMDIILCSVYINSNLVAVGSKDGSLIFYDSKGSVVRAYMNVHKSALCTLQLIDNGQLLASGSDHPNPEILLWDLNSGQLEQYCRFKQHKGAVTAIQCLFDGEHMISGSYDKKLCVYSFTERKLKYTLPSNKSSVTALTLNSDRSKLISCCLENNALNIWQIVRSRTAQGVDRVETIFLEQIVENSTMICSVVSSVLNPDLVFIGTKDGKLKLVDIGKGEAVKNLSCCNNAIVEMFVIERPEGLPIILCWPCKEQCFKVVDCDSGKVVNQSTRGSLDFSCGVGPKATRADGGFLVCSQGDDRQVYSYRINRSL